MEIFRKIWAFLGGICWYWFAQVLLKSRLFTMKITAAILFLTLIFTGLFCFLLFHPQRTGRKRSGKFQLVFALVGITLLMAMQAFAGVSIQKSYSTLNKVIVDEEKGGRSKNKSKRRKKEKTSAFYLYVSGIDTRGSLDEKSRSDVNLVMAINPQTHKIFVSTIPRDTYLPIAGPGQNQYDKLTHAGLYGPRASMETLSNLFSIDISYYVRVNFSSMEQIVDALGGIEVDNPEAFTSVENYEYPQGKIHLDGKRALVFARERYQLKDGELARGKNHIRIIKGIIEKLTSPSVLLHYSDLLEVMGENVQTNIPESQILSLIRGQLENNKSWSIESGQVQGKGLMGLPSFAFRNADLFMFVPDEDSVWDNYCQLESVMENESQREKTKPSDWMDHIQTAFNHTITYDQWKAGVPVNHSNWHDPDFGKDTREERVSPEEEKRTYYEDPSDQKSSRPQEDDYFEHMSDLDEILRQLSDTIQENPEKEPAKEDPASGEEKERNDQAGEEDRAEEGENNLENAFSLPSWTDD